MNDWQKVFMVTSTVYLILDLAVGILTQLNTKIEFLHLNQTEV